ncbi:MAG TPA: acetyl-CoA C-acyltransferase [Iamia sp.]|nr:acetyl-CoA C-acyltransferase [Iamia sp.]
MREVVIVEAVRTPTGRRGGGLSTLHSADLLARAQRAAVERSGIDPAEIGQVIGGCVSQVGMQGFNVTRTAWLSAGFPITTAATTIDAQCGSSQQATNVAAALVAAGVVDVAMACGVENMSGVPMGASMGQGVGKGIPKSYFAQHPFTTQFQGAELIAQRWGIGRDELDAFGLRSQERAAAAWDEGRFATQAIAVGDVTRDEGLRATTLEGLAGLKAVVPVDDPVVPEGGRHTAGTSSQISDGAAAVIVATPERAAALGLTPRARIVDTCLVGSDPVLMLTGPIDATEHLLARTGLSIGDIDVTEINEAFASVVLAWLEATGADPGTTNPNGGAIAIGHPLGATGAILLTKALHELERVEGRYGLVTMCCGGGLGTGTVIERL